MRAGVVVPLLVAWASLSGPSPADRFRAHAETVCGATNAGMRKLKQRQTPTAFARYVVATLPLFQRQYARLRTLTVPAELRADVATALASEETQIGGIRALAAAIVRGEDPVAAFRRLDTRMSGFSAAEDAAWKRLGIQACRSG